MAIVSFYLTLANQGSQPIVRELLTLLVALEMCEVDPVVQSGTRFFLWRRPVKDELSVDSQATHVFSPRRGFLFESQMQSESERRSSLRSGNEHGSLFPAMRPRPRGGMALRPRNSPKGYFSFCRTESARVLLSQSFQVHRAAISSIV